MIGVGDFITISFVVLLKMNSLSYAKYYLLKSHKQSFQCFGCRIPLPKNFIVYILFQREFLQLTRNLERYKFQDQLIKLSKLPSQILYFANK